MSIYVNFLYVDNGETKTDSAARIKNILLFPSQQILDAWGLSLKEISQ